MGIKHSLRKKNSEHPITEAQRETPKLLNNLKSNLFSLKITVYCIWHGQKWGCSNLLHPPTSTLSVRGKNRSCVSSKFTFSHIFKKTISQEQPALER